MMELNLRKITKTFLLLLCCLNLVLTSKEEQEKSRVSSLGVGGSSLFSHLNGQRCPFCIFSYFPTLRPYYHLPCFNSGCQKRKGITEELYFATALVNLKKFSLPKYKSDKMKVSDMNKLKIPYFQVCVSVCVCVCVCVYVLYKCKNNDSWAKSGVKSLRLPSNY